MTSCQRPPLEFPVEPLLPPLPPALYQAGRIASVPTYRPVASGISHLAPTRVSHAPHLSTNTLTCHAFSGNITTTYRCRHREGVRELRGQREHGGKLPKGRTYQEIAPGAQDTGELYAPLPPT